ncbi:MAG: hypothetical protein A2161_06885 [Candidatus Schekmanbacteria bacterium RBG_13_48_7]|uniref:Uncharacterized protein n=1 Tax=Candidatus Schekmanbacteria bacterium RBG_13_48_7 TaxID=1817878 RepID=A0A1F7RLR7_9BACT|nr:MAG: hypothetical protein A2161_06885 [Candidatus Schekmanbacteria bacterium RBG_13_48_7]
MHPILINRIFKKDNEGVQFNYDTIKLVGWEADILTYDLIKMLFYIDCRNEEDAALVASNLQTFLEGKLFKFGRISEVQVHVDILSINGECKITNIEEQLNKYIK